MLSFDKFKEHAKRILGIPSHSESGNEELARYLQSMMHDYGIKTLMQPVNHSVDHLSKRQVNLIGFVSERLVDRSTRRGSLFVSPLDVSTGNLPHLWTATQGNPHSPAVSDQGIVGAGAVQGKLDFLARVFAAVDLVDKRHKNPIYLAGTCGSYHGMMGAKFLIESLAVNPKEVFTFAPTELEMQSAAPGQIAYSIDLESSVLERDSRGYNRGLTLTAYGVGVDYATPGHAVNAFALLMDLLLQATEEGFDFQWVNLSTKAASGSNPDWASASIALTSFQLEDFKQFLRRQTNDEDRARFFRIDFTGIIETGTRFIPTSLIEVILELEHEWKGFIGRLNSRSSEHFRHPSSVGALFSLKQKSAHKLSVIFELRFLPHHEPAFIDEEWRTIVARVSERYPLFHFSVARDYLVPGVASGPEGSLRNTNYLSDAGMFHKARFPVRILGAGTVENLPKGPNEAVLWSELERAIEVYHALMLKISQG